MNEGISPPKAAGRRDFFRAYAELMRLHQPVGVFLLYWPCVWGILLATREIRASTGGADTGGALHALLLFLGGALIMRGAGCVINDLWDRGYDRHVARTRTRPLASGAVKPWQAVVFLLLLLPFGLAVALQFPPAVLWLSCAALPLVALYPLAKRVTWWPQVILGLTFNLGAPIGYAALAGGVSPSALLLYAAAFFWTLGYDTLYAHQDKKDDIQIGVRSTALRLGRGNRVFISICYATSCVLLGSVGWQSGFGAWFGWVLFLFAAGTLSRALSVDFNQETACRDGFFEQAVLGGVMALGFLSF